METIVVTGGAGYIGSHLVLSLTQHPRFQHCHILIVDNLQGVQCYKSVSDSPNIVHIPYNLADPESAQYIFHAVTNVIAVFHFAADLSVEESFVDPLWYWQNNVNATQTVLDKMVQENIKYFIFSSSAAVYGEPMNNSLIKETHPTIPINPYGETKLAVEKLLKWCNSTGNIKSVSFRYFNACGADRLGKLKENRKKKSHLIPLILDVAQGKQDALSVFGTDYPTADGTCIRDYVHVSDIVSAHIKGLEFLMDGGQSEIFNLGSGKGYSVQEVVDAARNVTKHPIPVVIKERRKGDPAVLVADTTKAESILGWKREYDNIKDIIETAWQAL